MNAPARAVVALHNFLHDNELAVAFAAAFLVFTLASCTSSDETAEKTDVPEMPAKMYMTFGEYVNATDSLPRLRYAASGLVSLNDRCAVRKVKLNPRMPPAWVNGQPIGFC